MFRFGLWGKSPRSKEAAVDHRYSCVFCKKKDADVLSVDWMNYRSQHPRALSWHFHSACVKSTLCASEVSKPGQVDIALEIVERVEAERLAKAKKDKADAVAAIRRHAAAKEACATIENEQLF